MESAEEKIIATVKSPGKGNYIRKARGFSLKEIIEAGKNIYLLKQLGIDIDYRRKSSYNSNVDALKKLRAPKDKKTKKKKKRDWIPKEQRMKPKKAKKKVAPKKKPKKKPVAKKAEPEKVKLKKEKITPPISDKMPLTELSGLGPATAKKFEELGVDCVQELIKEKPGELAMLIKGCSEERIGKWIEEGKERLK
ncbi:MAG: ribosomal protein L13e [Promethearchaeota archaeon]